jgi:hypothetical protein
MRQLALDLPFEEVGDIVDLKGQQCDTEARRAELQNGDESLFWLMTLEAFGQVGPNDWPLVMACKWKLYGVAADYYRDKFRKS